MECPPTEAVAASCTQVFTRHCWPQPSRCSGSSGSRGTAISVIHSEFPMMLRIPLLLTCGLSRYVWSINTSITHAVISLTTLGNHLLCRACICLDNLFWAFITNTVLMALRHLKISETGQGYLDHLHNLEGHPIEFHSGIAPRLPNRPKFVVLGDFVIPRYGWCPLGRLDASNNPPSRSQIRSWSPTNPPHCGRHQPPREIGHFWHAATTLGFW